MTEFPGVTCTKKKNGQLSYRSSITIQSKHVSLGSFSTPETASKAYREACDIIRNGHYDLKDYDSTFALDFLKFVVLLNYRHSGLYFKTPIYLQKGFFYYYLSPEKRLIFDREDLFFYATHKIQSRGGYLFICDYGSQYSILSRYGIKNYAKKDIDYFFVNKNEYDFRYENIKVINQYMGVSAISQPGSAFYECVIHINGNYIVGRYCDEISAAIAYNKAVDILADKGIEKKYIKNYIHTLSSEEYRRIYETVTVSKRIRQFTP